MHTTTPRALGALLAALLLSACADEVPPAVAATVSSSSADDAAARCGTVLTPDAELLDETVRVAARWSVATGCDVRVGEGGTRVWLVPVILDGETERPGFTTMLPEGGLAILVSPRRFDPRAAPNDGVLAHEVGHVLNNREDHVEDETSLMCRNGGLGFITAADLAYVCDGYPCAAFVPEA